MVNKSCDAHKRNENKACEVVGVHAATGNRRRRRPTSTWESEWRWQPSWIGLENITCPYVRLATTNITYLLHTILHALNGAEQFVHTTWLFICATFLSPTAVELLIDPNRAPLSVAVDCVVDISRSDEFIIAYQEL